MVNQPDPDQSQEDEKDERGIDVQLGYMAGHVAEELVARQIRQAEPTGQ